MRRGPPRPGPALLVALPLSSRASAEDHGAVHRRSPIMSPDAAAALRRHDTVAGPARRRVGCPDAAGARTHDRCTGAAAAPMRPVTAALGWGALAASSLVVGALLGLARTWPDRASARARVRRRRPDQRGQLRPGGGGRGSARGRAGLGLAAGALTYFWPTGSSSGARRAAGPARPSPSARSSTASPSRPCSASAWRPARASASACSRRSSCRTCPRRSARRPRCARPGAARQIMRLWVAVASCTLATVAGYAIADVTRRLQGRDRRLRRRRTAGHADRLDDPRGRPRRATWPGSSPCSASPSPPRSSRPRRTAPLPVRAVQSASASSKTRFQQLACRAAVEVSTPSRSKRTAS